MNCICYAESKPQYEVIKSCFSTGNFPLEIKLLSGSSEIKKDLKAHTIFLLSSGNKKLPRTDSNKSVIVIPYDSVNIRFKNGHSCLPLITYGMSPKATISCSSISEDRLLISLQRSIKAFYGRVFEPQELIFNRLNSPFDTEILMINMAIRILLAE